MEKTQTKSNEELCKELIDRNRARFTMIYADLMELSIPERRRLIVSDQLVLALTQFEKAAKIAFFPESINNQPQNMTFTGIV